MTDRTSPVSLTDLAAEHLKNQMLAQDIPVEHGLRVGVEDGGCSGLSYVLGFSKAQETDEQYEVKGVKILMERAHIIYLQGMQIDYEAGIREQGFRFSNPNATGTCTCGSSFSAEEH